MSTATCTTDGCSNGGVPIELELQADNGDGTTSRVDSVVCGVCGQEITEIAE